MPSWSWRTLGVQKTGTPVIGASEDNANQSNAESDSEGVSITNSSPELVIGDDCLTCSDTKDMAVNLAWKTFCKKVQASCGPTKQGLWKDTQLEQVGNNHTTVCGSDYKALKTEQDLTLDRDPSSFEVSGMMVCTDQLM